MKNLTIALYFAVCFFGFALTGCVPSSKYPDIPVKEALAKYSYAELSSNTELLDSIVDDPNIELKLAKDRKQRREQILSLAKMSDTVKDMDKEIGIGGSIEPTQPEVAVAEEPKPIVEIRAESKPVPSKKSHGISIKGSRLNGTPLDNSPIHDLVWKSEDNTYFEYVNTATSSSEYYVSAKGNSPTYIADCELAFDLMGNGLIRVAGLDTEPLTPEYCAGGRVVITRGMHYATSKIAIEIVLDGKLIYSNTYYQSSH